MTSRTCPKCRKKSVDQGVCNQCGLNFAQYEKAKLERLGEVYRLLSENKFNEAKQVAEKLPGLFPDNQTDFVLLLSNINRDISILEKFKLAQKAYGEKDYAQVCLLLRNIKAFDSKLNERVVGLRRKAEQPLHNNELFNRAVEAFNQGNYPAAKGLFEQISSFASQEEVSGYLQKIAIGTKDVLREAIDCINTRQFALAETRFAQLRSTSPDIQDDIAGYLDLLSKRIEIKDRIVEAATRAREENRLVEAKILYSYLGLEFPDFLPQIQPFIQEIGRQAIINLADLQDSGTIDLAALGVDIADAGTGRIGSVAANMDVDVRRDSPPKAIAAIAAIAGSKPGTADVFSPPVEIDVEGIPDFIF